MKTRLSHLLILMLLIGVAIFLSGCLVTGGVQWTSLDGTSAASIGFSQDIKLPKTKGLSKNSPDALFPLPKQTPTPNP